MSNLLSSRVNSKRDARIQKKQRLKNELFSTNLECTNYKLNLETYRISSVNSLMENISNIFLIFHSI